MKRLILIDLSHLFWSSWHATADQDVSAAFERTVGKVNSLADGYDLCAICCDHPPYKRKELLPTYKAQREAQPVVALEQLRRVKDRLEADGRLLWSVPGYEADDVIATAAGMAVLEGIEVTIASADKDLLQLVSDPMVRVVSTRDGALYTEADVYQKFAVKPNQIALWLAYMGDKSDNVPGVPGVGPKIAADIVNGKDVSDRIKALCIQHRDAIELAKRVVLLDSSVPIDFDAVFVERKAKPLREPGKVIDAEFDEEEDLEDLLSEPDESGAQAAPPPEKPAPAPVQPAPVEQATVTALAVRPAEWTLALEPADSRGAIGLAGKLFESRLFPQFGNPEAILAIILRGRSLGIDSVTALANFHVIEGKATMHASLIVALVLRSGKAKYFQCIKTTNDIAIWKTHRVGHPEPVQLEFGVDDALAAGLLERSAGSLRGVSKSGKASNWDKWRRTMLRWRCAVELARLEYSDVTTGLYTPDEVAEGSGPEQLERRYA